MERKMRNPAESIWVLESLAEVEESGDSAPRFADRRRRRAELGLQFI
jgi:hypothetical protein